MLLERGVDYRIRDFDASMVPVMLALMRSGGMMAHWREAMGKKTIRVTVFLTYPLC